MAHFAQLDENNIVTQVIVVNNSEILDENGHESEEIGINFCKMVLGEDTRWVQTSYSGKFRKNYAGIGYTYDEELDAFIPPQPWPSWSLNESTGLWQAPIPVPDEENFYYWDEENQKWIKD